MSSCIIQGELPDGRSLFVAVDPSARYVEGKPAERKFGAVFTPYRDKEAALAALKDADATPISGGSK